jgi:hypothetical protein
VQAELYNTIDAVVLTPSNTKWKLSVSKPSVDNWYPSWRWVEDWRDELVMCTPNPGDA